MPVILARTGCQSGLASRARPPIRCLASCERFDRVDARLSDEPARQERQDQRCGTARWDRCRRLTGAQFHIYGSWWGQRSSAGNTSSRPIVRPIRLQTDFRRIPHPPCDTIELAVLLPGLILSPQPVCRPLMKQNSGIVGQYAPPTPQSKASGRILRRVRENLHRACGVACSGRRDRGQAIVGSPATGSLDRRAFA